MESIDTKLNAGEIKASKQFGFCNRVSEGWKVSDKILVTHSSGPPRLQADVIGVDLTCAYPIYIRQLLGLWMAETFQFYFVSILLYVKSSDGEVKSLLLGTYKLLGYYYTIFY